MTGVSPNFPGASPVDSASTLDGMVREVVGAHRPDGLARAYADAARLLGITPRRVRGFWHGEVRDPRASEAQRIRDGYARWCEAEARRCAARMALLETRLAALRGDHACER